MNPGALLVVVGVFILIFGGCSLGDCKPRLPKRAMEWVPYACAFGIIVLVGLWLFSASNRR